MSRIFLSHSSQNNDSAVVLRDWLSAHGWDDVFLDLGPQRGIAAGDRWERSLNQAALRCEAVLFLVSRAWLASDWCLKEFNLAHRLNKRLFGLLIEEIPMGDLPATLTGTWQLVPLASGRDHIMLRAILPGTHDQVHVTFSQEGLTRLRIGLERAGLDARFFSWPPQNDPKRPPYRGLLPLEAADAGIFFGREAPTIEALDRIRGMKDGAVPRLLVLLGASGAGKSSFLRAGLLPRLMRDDRNFLPLPVIRPERAAINGEAGLLRSLESAFGAHNIVMPRADIRRAIEGGATTLRPLLQTLIEHAKTALVADDANAKAPILVMAVDQGEELFPIDRTSEGATLLNLLRELLSDDTPALLVVVTIRSDAYEDLQTANALEGVNQQTLSLMPMPRGAYQGVIEGPAARLKDTDRSLVIEPALTQAVLSDIEDGGGRDALPLLAFTLERLYLEYGGRGHLTLKDYDALGRIKGSIEAAVERAFRAADNDARIPRDHDARLALLRRGLIPWLAGIDPDSGSPRRQKARISEIPEEARPLIDLLVEQRLLSTDVDDATGERTIEPAHESLLRQWGSLQRWLEEDFAALTNLETVKRAARDWAANANSDDWLAHRAGRLEDAERLLHRPDLASKLDVADRAYLIACRERDEAERKEKTLALERRLRLQRRFSIAAVFAALIMTAVGGFAYLQKSEAEAANATAIEQRNKALITQSRFLSNLAGQQFEKGDAGTALLVAIEALPDVAAGTLKPYLPEAEVQLDKAWRALREHKIFAIPGLRGLWSDSSAGMSPDGKRVITVFRVTAWLWDAESGKPLAVPLAGHRGLVSSAGFSPDGKRVVTASWDNTARLWDAETGKPIGVPMTGHTGSVFSARFSPDGKRVVTASADKTARFWDAETGNPIGEPLTGHTDSVDSARFSPDGKRVVTASRDNTARLWDAETGKPIGAPLTGHTGSVFAAGFSPDGERVVTASRDKTARLWNAETGKSIGEPLTGHMESVDGARFSPDGRRVVTASRDNTARLWDAEAGKLIGVPLAGHAGPVSSAAFSPDGKLVVTASADGTARLWDAESGRPIGVPLTGHTDRVSSAAFSPDGKRILTVSRDNTVRLWDAETGNVPLTSHTGTVVSAAFSPDGKRVVTASVDQTARLWDAETGKSIGEPLTGHSDLILSAAFRPDGRRVVTASRDYTARLWDETGKPIGEPLTGHTNQVLSAAFSPDGKRVVTASFDQTARLWDAETGKSIGEPLTGHSDLISSAAFSPDGKRVVTASADKTARFWDAETGKPIGEPLTGHTESVNGARFSPDGKRVLTASERGTVRFWDAETGKPIGVLVTATSNYVSSVAFSPDGKRVIAAETTTLRLLEAETGKPIGVPLTGHTDRILSVAFSPDGKHVVTASDDKTARLWDAETGKPIGAPLTHTDRVSSAAFSPDGNRIVTASSDTARLWELITNTPELVARAKAAVPRCMTQEQRVAAFLNPDPPIWCIEMEKWPYQTQEWKSWLRNKRANTALP